MPAARLGFDNVISPQLMQGIANSEQQFIRADGSATAMRPETMAHNRSVQVPFVDKQTTSIDIGLMQINHRRRTKSDLTPKDDPYTEAFKFRFGESPDPLKMTAKDPYINTAVGHGATVLTRRHLIKEFKDFGLGDFDSIPHKQQAALISLAYNTGPRGLVRDHLKKDKNFSLANPLASISDPKLQGRLTRFWQGYNAPLAPEFQRYLDENEQNKAFIIKTSPDLATAKTRLQQGGYEIDEALFGEELDKLQNQPQPVESAPAEYTKTFTLPRVGEPVGKDLEKAGGILDTLLYGTEQAYNTFVKPAINEIFDMFGLPEQDRTSAEDIITKGRQLAFGLATDKSFGETASGQEVNKKFLGIPLASDLEKKAAEKDKKFFDENRTVTTESFIDHAEQIADIKGQAHRSDVLGGATEGATDIVIGGLGPSIRLMKGKKSIPPPEPGAGTATGTPYAPVVVEEKSTDLILHDIDHGQNAKFIEEHMKRIHDDLVAENASDISGFPSDSDLAKAKPALHGLAAQGKDLPKRPETALLRPGVVSKSQRSGALAYRRSIGAAIDTLKRMTPTTELVANTMENAIMMYERGSSQIMERMTKAYSEIWGNRFAPGTTKVLKGTSTNKFFNITRKESDAVVEWMARGGKDMESILKGDKWKFTDEQIAKVKKTSERMFTDATFPVSNHPIVRTMVVEDPVTGIKKPVGEPHMFYPNVPLESKLRDMLKGIKFETLYKVASDKNPRLTRELFRHQLRERIHKYQLARINSTGMPPGEVRTFAGLEQARLFDPVEVADRFGTSVADVLRKFGYDADPIRSTLSFVIGGLKRGETGRVSQTIAEMFPQISDELLMNPVTEKAYEANLAFVQRAFNHFRGAGGAELLDQEVKGLIGNVMGFTSATTLQASFISNMAQFSVIGTQAKAGPLIKGLARSIRTLAKGDETARNSGALYVTMAQEWSRPESWFGRVAQTSLRSTTFTASEKFLRSASSNIGKAQVLLVAKNVVKDKGARHKLKWDGMALELGLDPDALRAEIKNNGMVSRETIEWGTATFVNKTAGRTDMRGLPLWAAEHKPLVKGWLQLQNFAFVNLNAIERAIIDAPTPLIGIDRAFKALGLGTFAGVAVNSLRDMLVRGISPLSEDGTIGRLNKETAKELAHSLVSGLGNVYGMLISSAMMGERGVKDAIIGVNGAMLVDVAIGTGEFVFDNDGVNPKNITKNILRRTPFVPLAGPFASAQIGKEIKQDKESEKLLRRFDLLPSGFGQNSFDSFP